MQKENMSQYEMEEGDVLNLANRSYRGGLKTIKKPRKAKREILGRNWVEEIQYALESSKTVIQEVLEEWGAEELVDELKPVIVKVAEAWGTLGEDFYLKLGSRRIRVYSSLSDKYGARGAYPHVGHGLTLGLLYFTSSEFCMGYGAEDVVREVERTTAYWRTKGLEGATRNDVVANYEAILKTMNEDYDGKTTVKHYINNHRHWTNFIARTCMNAHLPNDVFFLAWEAFTSVLNKRAPGLFHLGNGGSEIEAGLCSLIAVCWAALAPDKSAWAKGWVDGDMVECYTDNVDEADPEKLLQLPRNVLECRSILNGPFYELYCKFVEDVLDVEELVDNFVGLNDMKSSFKKRHEKIQSDAEKVEEFVLPSFYLQKVRVNKPPKAASLPSWPILVRVLSALHLRGDSSLMKQGLEFWGARLQLDEGWEYKLTKLYPKNYKAFDRSLKPKLDLEFPKREWVILVNDERKYSQTYKGKKYQKREYLLIWKKEGFTFRSFPEARGFKESDNYSSISESEGYSSRSDGDSDSDIDSS